MFKKMMLVLGAVVLSSAVYAADYPLTVWNAIDSEGVISEAQGNSFLYTVTVDQLKSGSKHTPANGWVRLQNVPNGRIGVDMVKYNQVEFDVTVNSETAGSLFQIYFGLACADGNKGEVCISNKFEPGKSYKIIIPMKAFTRLNDASLKKVHSLQFVIYEKHMSDGTKLRLRFNNLRLTSGSDGMIKMSVNE
ncbi:MAG: hypothetical protein E7058_10055 [Lentisphaerae bacterium]|nr:hypothetical protein [Lentisphaerota bacterium]